MEGLSLKEYFMSISDLIISILNVTDWQVYMISMIRTVKKTIHDKSRVSPDQVEHCRVLVEYWNSVSFF